MNSIYTISYKNYSKKVVGLSAAKAEKAFIEKSFRFFGKSVRVTITAGTSLPVRSTRRGSQVRVTA